MRGRAATAQVTRTADLPLFDPPTVELAATRGEGGDIQVRLVGADGAISTRWEGDGEILGSGTTVRWAPAGETDQLRVGVRSIGGVAVLGLRAKDVPLA